MELLHSMLPLSYFGKCFSLVLFRPEITSWKESLDLQTSFVRSYMRTIVHI